MKGCEMLAIACSLWFLFVDDDARHNQPHYLDHNLNNGVHEYEIGLHA